MKSVYQAVYQSRPGDEAKINNNNYVSGFASDFLVCAFLLSSNLASSLQNLVQQILLPFENRVLRAWVV